MSHAKAFLATFLILVVLVSAAASQEDTEQATQQLDRLRREIQEVEQRLGQSRHREQDLLDDLANTDRQIALRSDLIRKLEREAAKAQASMEASNRELRSIQSNLSQTQEDAFRTTSQRDDLADLVGRRAIYVYKHLRRDALKATLTSGSLLQWLTRQEYLRRIAAVDRSNMLRLDQKNTQLAALSSTLTQRQADESDRLRRYRQAAAYKERLLTEENSQSKALKARRAERETLLKRLRQDRDLLDQQLQEKKQAALGVESLIKTFETQREKAQAPVPLTALAPDLPFRQLKGRMKWPAAGAVIAGFGLQKHERLATVTENPGIDIAAVEGSSVSSVCAGRVTKITWLRGYGNTVIIDHRDGYYSVYAHLNQIQVREGQAVTTGETIGLVGQSGSIAGPRLHFEIWAQREKQDPLKWLAAK